MVVPLEVTLGIRDISRGLVSMILEICALLDWQMKARYLMWQYVMLLFRQLTKAPCVYA